MTREAAEFAHDGLFSPRTFSSDWEHFVVDRLNRTVPTRRLVGLADVLSAPQDIYVTVDKASLEFPLGINMSFAQLWERVRRTTDRTAEFLRELQLDLYSTGAHPVAKTYNSAHVHVGTLLDESAGIHLENQLFPYVPAFAALAANAPAAYGMWGEYKSYRVRYQARGDITPGSWRDPRTAQKIWGTDAGPKLYLVPTLEVRVTDCATSRRFLAEMATFIAAFVHVQGMRLTPAPPDPEVYRDYLVNRWCAARYGMQATFRRQGKTAPVAEILDEMLDVAAEGLQALGTRRAELTVINTMVARRLCQADAVLAVMVRYPDPYRLVSACVKLFRHWEWFDEWVEKAPPLDPVPALDEEAILHEHLQQIGEDSPLYGTRETMAFPPAAADAVVERLLAAGLITCERTPERGVLLSRTPGTSGPPGGALP